MKTIKKIKKVKGIIALCLMIGLAASLGGPGVIEAEIVGTTLTQQNGGGCTGSPYIKAKWEMNGPSFNANGVYRSALTTQGDDDLTDAGAQFDVPGVWNGSMNYTVCVIASDPNGVSDIKGVYADIYYPTDKAFHPMDPIHPDQIDGGISCKPDYGLSGCGAFIEQNTLIPLDRDDGYNLFCDYIKNGNNNLPTIYAGFSYDDICGDGINEGQLIKETAKVYCDDKTLTWEDPAGDYKVAVYAKDTAGNFSYNTLENDDTTWEAGERNFNYFEYLPFSGFEVDFDIVKYGEVVESDVAYRGDHTKHKKIAGDLVWDGPMTGTSGTHDNPASVRNVGNTRLNMVVEQDDMGLGESSGVSNVEYDARVGSNEEDWVVYDPWNPTELEDILDLSEMEEMDFSILVTKFGSPQSTYNGTMTLSCVGADFRQCWN